MMKALNLGVLAAAVAGLLIATPVSANATLVAQSHTATKVDDSTLADRINTKLDASTTLKRYDIDASVTNGVVTLTGKVRTAAERTRAARDAGIPGVVRVDNKITL